MKLAKTDALKEYEKKQAEIKKLLKQIDDGLRKHSQDAAQKPENWGYLGDLEHTENQLREIRDFICKMGEYT